MTSTLHAAIAAIGNFAKDPIYRQEQENGKSPLRHLWKPSEVNAITLALATERPLLVRGEPGTGKTQLAHAAAAALGWRLHASTLHARSEPHDLLYRFDAVRRLADAQINVRKGDWTEENDKKYWEPQALWLGLNHASTYGYGYGHLSASRHACAESEQIPGHVVLIDEIDKAPSEVPNGLLEVLGDRQFAIPGLGLHIKAQDGKWPLVIITTNEERELPAPFLRRCVVLTHDLPSGGEYRDWLIKHAKVHFGATLDDSIISLAAEQLTEDRQNAQNAQFAPPGLAEYLDLLYALHALPGDLEQKKQWLDALNQYAFLKHRVDGEGKDFDKLRQDPKGVRKLPSSPP